MSMTFVRMTGHRLTMVSKLGFRDFVRKQDWIGVNVEETYPNLMWSRWRRVEADEREKWADVWCSGRTRFCPESRKEDTELRTPSL